MPLRLRLSLLFALATAAVIAVAGTAFVLQLRVGVDASLDPGLRAQLAEITDDLTTADDPEPVASGVLLQVLTPDGRVLSTSPAAAGPALLDPEQRRRAGAGEISFISEARGARVRLLATSTSRSADAVLVVVGTRTEVSDVAVQRAVLAIAVGGPLAVLLAGAGAWLLAGAALRPVERDTDFTARW